METASDIAARKARIKQYALRFSISLGILLLLLIPSYIAIATYVVQKNAPQESNIPEYESIQLTGPTGTSILSSADGDTLLSIFLPLLASESEVDAIPDSHQSGRYTATMQHRDISVSYHFFFSPNSEDCYFTAPDGKRYVAPAHEKTKLFLNSSYAFELYTGAKLPTLTTAATDEVTPTLVSWYYRTQNGSFTPLTQTGAATDLRIYPIANDIAFYFSALPDSHEVVIRKAEAELYRGPADGISLTLDEQADFLDLEITATYDERDGASFYGTLIYRFRMEVVEAARFTPDAFSVPSGDFFIVRGENVKNPDKLEIAITPTQTPHVVFEKDDAVYIAFSAGKAGIYGLQITYGTITAGFELIATLSRVTHHTPDAAVLKKDLDYAALLRTVLPRLIHEKGAATATVSRFPLPPFATYTAERIWGYGDTLTVKGTDLSDAALPFDLYRTNGAITALAAGRVLEIGVDEYIGKYVIVDHGCGLYTWYAGLSEYRVSQNDAVAIGQDIGIASTTLYAEPCALVMATLGKAALSVEYLSSHGFGQTQAVTE